jgi:hypothetical protein
METFVALLGACAVAWDVLDVCAAAANGAARKCAW